MDCSFRFLKQNPCYTVTQSVFVFPVCVTFTLYQTDNLSVNPLHNPICPICIHTHKGHTPADTCSHCCGEILEWWCQHNVQPCSRARLLIFVGPSSLIISLTENNLRSLGEPEPWLWLAETLITPELIPFCSRLSCSRGWWVEERPSSLRLRNWQQRLTDRSRWGT